jgi:hypothetical protein
MPATTRVLSYHGAAPTGSAFPAGGRMHRGDSDPTTDAATSPVVIPTSGEAFSWSKFFKLEAQTAPTGTISNLRVFGAGAWATGVALYLAKTANYAQPNAAEENARIANGVSAATYTAASPLVINAGTVVNAATGVGTQDYLQAQMGVGPTASAGVLPNYTLTYRYDET